MNIPTNLSNLSRALTTGFDRLPLGGKYTPKDMIDSLFRSRTAQEERFKFIALNALLGLSEVLHMGQAAIGINEFQKDAHRYASDPTILHFAETAMDGAYALINLGVVGAHTILLARLWKRACNGGFRSTNPKIDRPSLGQRHGALPRMATVLLTLGAQVGYLSTTEIGGDHRKAEPSEVVDTNEDLIIDISSGTSD